MELFFELIQSALGTRETLSHNPSVNEWNQLYKMAVKQSLVGVCFVGVDRLSGRVCTTDDSGEAVTYIQNLPKPLLLKWIGQAEYLRSQNEVASRRAAEVTGLFTGGGFSSVVLKGQGTALLYPDPGLRAAGDIDLWVLPDVTGRPDARTLTIQFMKKMGWKIGPMVLHHTDVEMFPDVEVEVHHYPSFTYDPFRWRKYKRWFSEQAPVQMRRMDPNVGFAYPDSTFNAVYQLLHIFRHVFHEGIGLRQLMDYYFVLQHLSESQRQEVMRTLEWMGLKRFAAAVMYVEQDVFALENDLMLCTPDMEAGRFLLDEILKYGNFGQYNEANRDAHRKGFFALYIHNVRRLFSMIHFYPSEVLWAPFWKLWHFAWRVCVCGYRMYE